MGLFDKLREIIKKGKNRELDELNAKQMESVNINNQMASKLVKRLSLSDKEKKERVSSLTARERDIYYLLIEGFTLKEAATQSDIKYSTANTHMTGIYRKLNVNTRAELIINYRNISG